MKRLYALILSLIPIVLHAFTLFSGGQTSYTVVIDANASPSEKTAAQELQSYLKQISGADFRISNDLRAKGQHIYVGYNSRVAALTGKPRPKDDDEAFVYQSVESDIVIYGGRERGTMYGVFTFLSKELGVRWYAFDCTHVPKLREWDFKELQHSEAPAIRYRLNLYYDCYNNAEWAAHNRSNMSYSPIKGKYGNMVCGSPFHTLPMLLPKEEHFARHPEYFALRNGKRDKNAQPCLSNPKVLDIVTNNLLKYIKDHPDFIAYDVSQGDNSWYCECKECRRIEARYGGQHSGLMIWFVNRVAERIERLYPDKLLCTFAYRYTRQAPVGIKARRNVVVRLCDIECCFAHPLKMCEKNRSFIQDMKAWRAITDQLFIWDYVVGFWQYLAPFPNFSVLDDNIKLFKDYGTIALLEEGQRESRGGEFAELRSWVLAQLMWNPYQDTNALVREFIRDYYGPAAKHVQQYFDSCQLLATPNTHFDIHLTHNDKMYSDTFVSSSDKLLRNALKACNGNAAYTDRVNRVRMQIMYLQCRRNPRQAKKDGTYKELIQMVKRHKAVIRESRPIEDFVKIMEG